MNSSANESEKDNPEMFVMITLVGIDNFEAFSTIVGLSRQEDAFVNFHYRWPMNLCSLSG
jgi:hypothetical protein